MDDSEDPTIIRAIDPCDWLEATALLYDHVEWMRGWTGFDPLAEQPALHDELRGLVVMERPVRIACAPAP